VKAAERYSKRKLEPMFKACKVLKEKMEGFQQSMTEKTFGGGFLMLVGANSPSGLASNTVRVAFLDEVDRYEPGAGTEGDQIALAIKRTDNFTQSRKIVITSTPGEEESSKISRWYKSSTQEVWNIPCPSCGEYTNPTIEDFDPRELLVSCKKCGCLHSEHEWKAMQKDGKYIALNPGDNKKRGFHLNAFSSPWVTWDTIGDEYLEAKKDPLEMMVFMNTRMGLPWKGTMALDNAFQDIYDVNRMDYGADLHEDILILTAGLDIQDTWGVIEVVGWSHEEKSFGVEYKVFHGDPEELSFWEQIDSYLEKEFYFKNGKSLKINMTFVDTGGHKTQPTYNYLYGKEPRGVYGIKGDNKRRRGYVIKTSKVNTTTDKPVTLVWVGVNDLKSLLFERLEKKEGDHGYCLFPSDPQKGYSIGYFKGLYSEKKIVTVNRYGYKQVNWEKIRQRNEPLDVRNYATAALKQLNPNFDELKKLRDGVVGSKKTRKKIKLIKKGGK